VKTTDIKGKPYIEVNERLKHFRANYPDHRLLSEIVSNDNGVIVMRAWVEDANGSTVAVGHAYEKEGSTFINKTSYVENCETSAWGRALANFGIGIDIAVASAEEVKNAQANQGAAPKENVVENEVTKPTGTQLAAIFKAAQEHDGSLSETDVNSVCEWYWRNNKKGGETMEAAAYCINNFGTVMEYFLKAQNGGGHEKT